MRALPARRPILVLLLALSVAACGTGSTATPSATDLVRPPAPTASPYADRIPSEVDVATAASMRDQGAFVLDVREPDEWATGHIEGATLIPLGSLASRTSEVPRDRDIVVVCRTSHRSAQGRDILLAAGFPAVTSMTGGMEAWTAAGQPVVTGQ